MKRTHRLRSPRDFARVRQTAPRSWPHALLVVYAIPNDLDRVRIGITVSSRVGNAVVRNKIRRRLREAMRHRLSHLAPRTDVLIVARPRSAEASWVDLTTALHTVLARAGLLVTPPATA